MRLHVDKAHNVLLGSLPGGGSMMSIVHPKN